MERHQDMLKEAVPKVKQRITKNAVKGYPEAYPLCKQSQDLYSLSPEE
ncbi:hypothetical protein HY468_00105 [Candidatus Roizmanbacteria bacterium]|nr:hypothetical protein [Candidatus Roizmanbacteria bacterium]